MPCAVATKQYDRGSFSIGLASHFDDDSIKPSVSLTAPRTNSTTNYFGCGLVNHCFDITAESCRMKKYHGNGLGNTLRGKKSSILQLSPNVISDGSPGQISPFSCCRVLATKQCAVASRDRWTHIPMDGFGFIVLYVFNF